MGNRAARVSNNNVRSLVRLPFPNRRTLGTAINMIPPINPKTPTYPPRSLVYVYLFLSPSNPHFPSAFLRQPQIAEYLQKCPISILNWSDEMIAEFTNCFSLVSVKPGKEGE